VLHFAFKILDVNVMIDIDTLLTWGATYKNLDAEEILFKEGGECHYYHQVITGQLRWVNISEEGKEYLQAIVNPSESIGELPLFDEGVYAATAIVNKNCTVLRLHKTIFQKLLKEYPELHYKFSKLLSQRVRFKFFMLKEITSQDPRKLILSIFQYMEEHNIYMCSKCHQIMLTRQQLADFTGLRVETVIRVIRLLYESNFLDIKKGRVYFNNMIPVIA
jgi:CRP-like cAMP-binding protein